MVPGDGLLNQLVAEVESNQDDRRDRRERNFMRSTVKTTLLALCATALALPAMASNFRAADAVYVPAAGKVSIFSTSVNIINMSDDAVEVDVAYLPTGAERDNRDGTANENLVRVATLAGNEAVSYEDFFVEVLGLGAEQQPFGQLLFFACRSGGDCVNLDENGFSPDFRDIVVEARIYSEEPGVVGTKGQLFSGLPWYSYISQDFTEFDLDRAKIIGLRQDDRFRSNYGLANSSQYSSTTIRVELFRNNGTLVGSVNRTLAPLSHMQENITAAFPGFTGEGYLVVTQIAVNPTNPSDPDPDIALGIPGFFAYASIVDNATDDPTTLEAFFPVSPNLSFYTPSKTGKAVRRGAVRH